jgi:hypothetical protein
MRAHLLFSSTIVLSALSGPILAAPLVSADDGQSASSLVELVQDAASLSLVARGAEDGNPASTLIPVQDIASPSLHRRQPVSGGIQRRGKPLPTVYHRSEVRGVKDPRHNQLIYQFDCPKLDTTMGIDYKLSLVSRAQIRAVILLGPDGIVMHDSRPDFKGVNMKKNKGPFRFRMTINQGPTLPHSIRVLTTTKTKNVDVLAVEILGSSKRASPANNMPSPPESRPADESRTDQVPGTSQPSTVSTGRETLPDLENILWGPGSGASPEESAPVGLAAGSTSFPENTPFDGPVAREVGDDQQPDGASWLPGGWEDADAAGFAGWTGDSVPRTSSRSSTDGFDDWETVERDEVPQLIP